MTYDNRQPFPPQQATGSAFDADVLAGVGRSPKSDAATVVAELIRARRNSLGLSLAQLAGQVGCARSYLSMIETGSRGDGGAAISPALLVRLESTLGLAAGQLTRAAQWSATPPGVRRQLTAMEVSQKAAAAALRAVLGDAPAAGSGAEAGTSAAGIRHNLDDAFRSGRLHALVTQLEGEPGEDPQPAESRSDTRAAPPGRLLPVQVPLINSVAAGYPREFTDLGYPARVADEYVLSPDVNDPDAFAARVVGDSMLPDYREGDIVVFSPARTVKSGMDCFVRLERDHETTFKRIVLDDEANPREIRLVPSNPAFAERTVAREDVALICAAVSVTRRI